MNLSSGRVCIPIYTDMRLQLKKFISASFLLSFFFSPSFLQTTLFFMSWDHGSSALCTCTWHGSRGKVFGYKVPSMLAGLSLKKSVEQEILEQSVVYMICIISTALRAVRYLVLNFWLCRKQTSHQINEYLTWEH